ncbi:MFS transporter [Salinispira pacifica]|uniref:Major facilitator family transporter n=1 Tax=Salinispira pacifica TaxID=1307761 RepID=V5WNF5_9SPIO|nr:MFS transporter [Salinispira pacifica]AHC16779.1 Major facilitator family transporter [Salinispira pacifica]
MSQRHSLSFGFIFLAFALYAGVAGHESFTLLPKHFSLLGYSPGTSGFIMSFTGLGGMLFMPLLALFVDNFRQKYILMAGYLIYGLSALCYFLEPSDPRLFAIPRLFQGGMITVTMVSLTAAVSHVLPPEQRSRGYALFGVLGQLGAMTGVSTSEWLFDSFGFPAFIIFASGALGVAAVSSLIFPEKRPDLGHEKPKPRDFLDALKNRSIYPFLYLALILGTGFGTMLGFLPDMVLLRDVGVIKPYYVAYPATVITIRLVASHWFNKFSARRILFVPLLMIPSALLLVASLQTTMGLIAAGIAYGVAHGVLFPVLQAELINRSAPNFRARMALLFQFMFNGGIFLAANFGGFLADRSLVLTFASMAAIGLSALPVLIIGTKSSPAR